MTVTSLRFVIDCSPLPNFYRRHIWTNISFLFTSQQSPGFVDVVGVTCNGLCLIFHWTVLRSCENFPVVVGYSPKQFPKLLLTSHSGYTECTPESDHMRRSRHGGTPLDDVFVRPALVRPKSDHKLRYTNQNASFKSSSQLCDKHAQA